MKVSVIGLGYIGLPTATMFAAEGIEVLGVDVNQNVVDTINKGLVHIIEPDLDHLVHRVVASGHLRAATVPAAADAFLIAVPTPFMDGKQPDLRYVEAAARAIAPVLKRGDIVILESTSPVGATEQMIGWLRNARPDLQFPAEESDKGCDVHVAYCPERVLPGQVVRELVENDRIIGGVTTTCTEKAKDVYRVFVRGELVAATARTAEMCKLTENAYRDLNIAFANELSLICERLAIDVWELIALANRHPRVNILQPGCGVGGHCIAVDPWFIVARTPEQARLIRAAREVNDAKPLWIIDQIQHARAELAREMDRAPEQVRIACYGLAFKPNIDDLRESPALAIAAHLRAMCGTDLLVVEPHIEALPDGLEGTCLADVETAVRDADLNVILVAHDQFRQSEQLGAARTLDFTGIFSRGAAR